MSSLRRAGRAASAALREARAVAYRSACAGAGVRLVHLVRQSAIASFFARGRVSESRACGVVASLTPGLNRSAISVSGVLRVLRLGCAAGAAAAAVTVCLFGPHAGIPLAVAGGALAVAAVLWPFWGVAGLAAALPFLPIGLIIGTAALAALGWLADRSSAGSPLPRRCAVGLASALLAAVLAVSSATSICPASSFGDLGVWLVGMGVAALIGAEVSSRRRLQEFLLCVAGGVLVAGAWGIWCFSTGATALEVRPGWLDLASNPFVTNRAYQPFGNPNLLACWLLLALPLAGAAAVCSARIWQRASGLAGFLVGCCLLALTYSRGAWIAFAVAAAVFACLMGRRGLLGMGLAGLLLFALMPHSITARLGSMLSATDASGAYRLSTWAAAGSLAREHWLTGAGLGRDAFHSAFVKYAPESVQAVHSHNLYLQEVCETGAPGLVAVLWVFAAAAGTALGAIRTGPAWLRAPAAGVAAALCGFLVQGFVDYTLWYYTLNIALWVVIGLAVALGGLASRPGEE